MLFYIEWYFIYYIELILKQFFNHIGLRNRENFILVGFAVRWQANIDRRMKNSTKVIQKKENNKI